MSDAATAAPLGQAPTEITSVSGTVQTAAAPASAPTSDWTSGFNDELKGYVQTKGFKDSATVLDSYRNLEKLVGVKERLIQIPDKEDDPAWSGIYDKLGRPKEPKEYGLQTPAGGDEKMTEWAKQMFHKNNLSRKQAEAIHKEYNDYIGGKTAETASMQSANLEKENTQLKSDWGHAYDQNVNLGRKAASAFGFDGPAIEAIESALGFSKTMKMFHSLGTKVGEDTFVGSSNGGGSNFSGAMTPDQARFKLSELTKDSDFIRRLDNGGAKEKEELSKLTQWASA